MTNISGVAVPKPKNRKREPVKVFPDGREVCDRVTAGGNGEYIRRVMEMVRRQGCICAICLRTFLMNVLPTFDHEAGRGVGGSHRDDVVLTKDRWPLAKTQHCVSVYQHTQGQQTLSLGR